jgi:hypothetical protein
MADALCGFFIIRFYPKGQEPAEPKAGPDPAGEGGKADGAVWVGDLRSFFIEVIEAKDLRNVEILRTQDPFVRVR